MTGAVRERIIKPMLAVYPPPQHLRGDAKRQAEALAVYEKALGRFDAATLAAGWGLVAAEHTAIRRGGNGPTRWRRPTPSGS